MSFPEITSREEWNATRKAFLVEEKTVTRTLDALHSRRRRLPVTQIGEEYVLETEDGGKTSFPEMFEGREQLILYFNMLAPGSDHICPGCSLYCDHVGNLEHLHARRTTFAVVSRATPARIREVKARMGWQFPWYSSSGTTFYEDFVAEDEAFGLAVFLRREGEIFQSGFTTGRGVELPCNTFGMLDMTPLGRQETWEDSPPGWPQEPAHSWVRLHDRYSP